MRSYLSKTKCSVVAGILSLSFSTIANSSSLDEGASLIKEIRRYNVKNLQHQKYRITRNGVISTGEGFTVWGALMSVKDVEGVMPGDSVCNSVLVRSKRPSDFSVEVVAHNGVSAPWLLAHKHVSPSDFTNPMGGNPGNPNARPKKRNVFSVCGAVPDNFSGQIEFRVHSAGAGNNYLSVIGSIHPNGTKLHNSNGKMTTLYDEEFKSGVISVMAINANNGKPVEFSHLKAGIFGNYDHANAFGSALIVTPLYESLRLKIRADQPNDIPSIFITHADTQPWDWQQAVDDAQSAYNKAINYLDVAWWAIGLAL